MARPACGGRQSVSGAPSLWATILAAVALASTVGGVVSGLYGFKAAADGIGAGVVTATSWVSSKLGLSVSALSSAGGLALAAIIVVAVVTAVVVSVWAWESHQAICGPPPFGKFACVSGVINSVTAGFVSGWSQVFGFTGNQPQIDVVVKGDYWPTVILDDPSFVWCAGCQNCPPAAVGPAAGAGGDPGCSPMLLCYYHNSQVCSASKGGAIGATVGAALGAVGGAIAAVAALGALGCTITGPFTWVCWIILVVILLIVILVVVLAALIGSLIGTQAGKAAAGGTAAPTTGGTGATPLAAGAYVSVRGNLVQARPALGANALWFAGWIPNANGATVDDATATNGNGTTVLGSSTGMAPFCHTDPDAAIRPRMDICVTP
jgi:hypothetical protein